MTCFPLILGLAMLTAGASAATAPGSQTATAAYIGPTNPTLPQIVCPAEGGNCSGGARFPAAVAAPLSLLVVDDVVPVVDLLICQDLDDDGLCGEPDEPRWNECGRLIELPAEAGFSAGRPTSVYVIAGARCGDLVATTGTIELSS